MKLEIDTTGTAREEILLEIEFNPPPEFKTTMEAIEWAEVNLPINTRIKVISKNNRVWYEGFTRVPRRRNVKVRRSRAVWG